MRTKKTSRTRLSGASEIPPSVLADVERVAKGLLANRTRRDELRKLLATTMAHLQQLATACFPTDAEVNRPEYQTLMARATDVDAELALYTDLLRGRSEWRECALDGESPRQARARLLNTHDATKPSSWREETTRDVELRLLLERGQSVYSIARAFDKSSNVADGPLRKRLERMRTRRLKQLEQESRQVRDAPQILWVHLQKARRLRLDVGAEALQRETNRYLDAVEPLIRGLASAPRRRNTSRTSAAVDCP
jgi:hypothetical protein